MTYHFVFLMLVGLSPIFAGNPEGSLPVPISDDESEENDLNVPIKKIKETDRQIANPSTPPAVKEELKREREGEVKKIESIGQSAPTTPRPSAR